MSHGHSRGHTSQQGKSRASNYDVEDGRSMKCCPGYKPWVPGSLLSPRWQAPGPRGPPEPAGLTLELTLRQA